MKRFFRLRVAVHRWRRSLEWRLRPLPWAAGRGETADFPLTVAQRFSPLRWCGGSHFMIDDAFIARAISTASTIL